MHFWSLKDMVIIINEIFERDWKILCKKLPTWQEAYIEILSSLQTPADKFWEFKKILRQTNIKQA